VLLKIVSSLLFLNLILTPLIANAVIVLQVKDNKAVLDNEDEDVEVGQIFYALSNNKKRTGNFITVTAVKGGKSIAILTRGRVYPKQLLEAKTTQNSSEDNSAELEDLENTDISSPIKVFRTNSNRVSLLLNFMSNSMTAKESDGVPPTPQVEDVLMKGISLGVTATIDYPVKPWFEFRGTVGYEPFVASGTSGITGCDNATSRDCRVNIGYLAGGGYGRFNVYTRKQILTWVGFGVTGRFPATKVSTALRTNDLNLTSSYGFAVGADYFISNKNFIPFSIEQHYFFKSDTVQANFLSIRVGYGLAY